MKKKGLLSKIFVFSILMAAIAMLLCGVVLYALFRYRTIENIRQKLESHVGVINYEIFRYNNFDWLMTYWKEHADIMSMPPEDIYEYMEWYDSYEDLHHINLTNVSKEEILAMSEEEQLRFAECCYFTLYTQLSSMPTVLDVDRATIFYPEDEDAFIFFQFTSLEDPEYDNRFFVGTKVPYDISRHPEVQMLLTSDAFGTTKMETYRSEFDGKEYASAYMPISVPSQLYGIGASTISLDEAMKAVRSDVLRFEGWIALIILAAIFIEMLNMYYGIIRPTVRLQKEIRNYTETRDSATLAEQLTANRPGHELGQLSDDLILMGKEIDRHVREIAQVTAEKERIGAELNVAARIQTGVLPRDFDTPSEKAGCDLYASMTPAKEVGGDLYDFFFVDDDHLALVIGDVSDKGVPAALFMVTVKALLKSIVKHGRMSPKDVLGAVGDQMCEGNDECMFVTIWLGILELSTGRMICSNAGHEYPILCPKDGIFSYYREDHGLPVATMEGAEYTDYELTLHPGDTLFVYSDGLPEAQNKANEQFGESRMLGVLNEAPSAKPKELIERMTARVSSFVGDRDPFDDLTMLCIRVRI